MRIGLLCLLLSGCAGVAVEDCDDLPLSGRSPLCHDADGGFVIEPAGDSIGPDSVHYERCRLDYYSHPAWCWMESY